MVTVKEAVKSATSFVEGLYPGAKDIRLEEVEPNSSQWSVVVSFRTEDPSLAYVMGTDNRLFKTVLIDSMDGTPVSLKIWNK
jgi:hypothetical protein